MYNLPYFKESDKTVVLEFIQKHPFALIAGCDEDGKPVATQIPVFIDEREGRLYLTGHMMRNSDHHRAIVANPQVLCVFTGPHTYVSATWYSNPHQASTWNYMSVHARGNLSFLDEEALVDMLKKTSLHFEKNNPDSATVYDNLPVDYRSRLQKAIVAFEVNVQELDTVFKLSQNRDAESYHNIIGHLNKQDAEAQAVAAEMQKRAATLFST
ncbi:FMN-binding negative transcriptional regulator [Flavisolibacter nicotianae]|uniref:FMN-binding negative transcriptional regulator n=1 Tax=Flavisolibacter nicotianae TaxID=2364882 RepID=UPI000EB142A3|nr:FMN-binding negative transcriptional regulator [Flavisolibacter nicotianae]